MNASRTYMKIVSTRNNKKSLQVISLSRRESEKLCRSNGNVIYKSKLIKKNSSKLL